MTWSGVLFARYSAGDGWATRQTWQPAICSVSRSRAMGRRNEAGRGNSSSVIPEGGRARALTPAEFQTAASGSGADPAHGIAERRAPRALRPLEAGGPGVARNPRPGEAVDGAPE